jgi:hypothetical protein
MKILILYALTSLVLTQISFKYTKNDRFNLTEIFRQYYFISGYKTVNKHQCLVECNKINECRACLYTKNSQSNINCLLFNATINSSDLVISNESSIYVKKCKKKVYF